MAGKCEVGSKELQQSGNEILISLVKNYLEFSSGTGSEATIRFRSPYLQTTKHDARGDAVALIVEHLHQRSIFFQFIISYFFFYGNVIWFLTELHLFSYPIRPPLFPMPTFLELSC